ncbi:Membrane protein involved in the export of O-antigen and teichoic acid [Fibrobacter sp. UWB15]|uniref:oligosaccharide flippase family protein n=1 Tax=unclassified Fibrobacter TaxID=2634177 RepID=UPI00091FC2F8|nr:MULTISPECIES: oligosaccharide flippase family protein [unclassified Fibrobacter]PWJ66416.1 O-antigen/teichoic acid export membrane protein [Fibrobacter sp. UWB6]SHG04341.1 Membrane protein involved in the export of O-antigen and teichoic acid [Fibrobacter sp. UWB8]SMG21401.1 Membrane protein involved in the export of O-antigen and teichoic acid [Fibrobacter sp. UWB15]
MIGALRKYNSLSIEAKASLWYLFCNLVQKGISFIVIPLYTRLLTTSEYGAYTVFQSWRDLILIFATLNLSAGVFTRGLVKNDEPKDKYTAQMQGLSSAIAALTFLIVMLFIEPFRRLTGFDEKLIIALFVYYIFNPSFLFWSVRQRVENKYKSMVAITLLASILVPAVSLLMFFLTNIRANALIYGFLYVQIAVGMIFFVKQFVDGRAFFSKIVWWESLKFNIPLIPHYLSLIVLAQSDRLMIDHICGTSFAGIYSLTYNIGQIILIVIASINGSLVPWMYKKLKSGEYHSIAVTSNMLCVLLGLMSAIVMLLAPEVVLIMGGSEYMPAKWCIPPVVMGTYFTFCYGLFSTVEFYIGKTSYVAVASFAGAVLNVALNFLFIPKYGFIAAAYTTEVCYMAFMVLHYFFMKKMTKERVFDIKGMIVICSVVFASSLLFAILYDYDYIRWIAAVFVLLLILFKRRKFVNMLKGLKAT